MSKDNIELISILESLRGIMLTVKHDSSFLHLEKINSLLYRVYLDEIDGVALDVELDKIRQSISRSLGFENMKFDEEQSYVWNEYILFVTDRMKNTRMGLSWITNIPNFPS